MLDWMNTVPYLNFKKKTKNQNSEKFKATLYNMSIFCSAKVQS